MGYRCGVPSDADRAKLSRVDRFLCGTPGVTSSWTCPWFEAIFALCFAAIGCGLLAATATGAVLAVITALYLGALMGKRKLNRNMTGYSC